MRMIFFIIFISMISGCAYQGDLRSWDGMSEQDVLSVWGVPAAVYNTDEGKLLKYAHSRIGGTEHASLYCDVNFFIDNHDRVTRAIWEGNMGGCNRLIKRNPIISQP